MKKLRYLCLLLAVLLLFHNPTTNGIIGHKLHKVDLSSGNFPSVLNQLDGIAAQYIHAV